MPDEPQGPRYQFSIVVLGAMNPRIHHPWWYKYAGFFTDAEAQAAVEAPSFAVTANATQFTAQDLRITVLPDRWEVFAQTEERRERAMKLAIDVFDSKLTETPIHLFAFNNEFVHTLEGKDVNSLLATKTVSAGLGLKRLAPETALIRFAIPGKDGGRVNLLIEPTNRADQLWIRINAEHPVRAPSGSGYFELGGFMREHFERDYVDAKRYAAQIVSAVSEAPEVTEE